MSGVIRMSALPATGWVMPLCRAASGETALSNCRGPFTRHPVISPRSFISVRVWASTVAGIFSLTFSTAHSTATLGWSSPKARATFTALRMMSALALRSGAMVMAESLTKNSRSKPETFRIPTWLISPVPRRPSSLFNTALSITEVSTKPFMGSAASPRRTRFTAVRQAWAASSSSTMV